MYISSASIVYLCLYIYIYLFIYLYPYVIHTYFGVVPCSIGPLFVQALLRPSCVQKSVVPARRWTHLEIRLHELFARGFRLDYENDVALNTKDICDEFYNRQVNTIDQITY